MPRKPKWEPEYRKSFLHIISVLTHPTASPMQKRLGQMLDAACDGREDLLEAMQSEMNEMVREINVVKAEIKGIMSIDM